MGILNVTPDSFYDGGRYDTLDKALQRAEEMAEEGADIIDIGGESTRPGSHPVEEEEELRRVIPVVKEISKRLDVLISVDTTKASVAEAALEEGAHIINDISGLKFEPAVARAVARYEAGIVLGHTPARPATMQYMAHYNSLIGDVMGSLNRSIELACEAGVDPDKIIVDPCIGFGKTPEQNITILRRLGEFHALGKPILVGTSRKSFISRVLGTVDEGRLEGTAATVALSIAGGASIVRVHDVLFMSRVARMADAILDAG
jgi:dihydropteroate synthase